MRYSNKIETDLSIQKADDMFDDPVTMRFNKTPGPVSIYY